MKNIFSAFIAIISIFIIASCCKRGEGGDAIIVASPQHHGMPVYGATVYVKFKATELPSNPTSDYDLKFEGEAGEDHVHCEGLRCGKYYLYTVGYDSSITQTVTGGIAVKIKYSERKKEIEETIPVTE